MNILNLPGRVIRAVRRRSISRWNHLASAIRESRRKAELKKKELWWDENWGTQNEKKYSLNSRVQLTLHADSRLCRLIDTSDFELSELAFIEAYLLSGDVFLDVGANIGLFTLLAADVVGNRGAVHSFEPCAATFDRLSDNIRLNGFGNIQANQLALSAEQGELELFTSQDGHDAWNSFAGTLAGAAGKRQLVKVDTLDDYLLRNQVTPSLIKIDVEGWESQVLKGGEATLSRLDAPDLLVEFTEQNCVAAGSTGKELFCAIERLGYGLFHIRPNLELLSANRDDDFPYCNLIATKNNQKLAQRLCRQEVMI
jgi:FkbM family methyltransferase